MGRTHFDAPPESYDTIRSGHHGDRRIELFQSAVADLTPPASVLEVGSATGFVLRRLAADHRQVEFTGVEPEERLLDYAVAQGGDPNVTYHHTAVGEFQTDQRFDLVISADVIHHFHDHPADFAAIRARLRPGGRWVAIEPNIWQLYITLSIERMRRSGYDEAHFRPRQIDPRLRAAGFRLAARRYLHVVPAKVRVAPPWLDRTERALERFRLIGGSVVYDLVAV